MIDRKISAIAALAYTLWMMGAVFVACSFFGPLQLAAVGLLLAGMGGVAQIRMFLCRMADREAGAFELGRESVRSIR